MQALLSICFLSLLCAVALAAEEETAGSDAAAASDGEKAMSVEEILKRDPTLEDYVDDTRCLHTYRIRDVEVIDDKHVSFKMSHGKYYLVQLDHRCPGLRRGKPVVYEPSGSRLCVHDGIRGVYENGLGSYTPGMRCAINGFQSVTKEQIVLLKDALKAERRKKKQA